MIAVTDFFDRPLLPSTIAAAVALSVCLAPASFADMRVRTTDGQVHNLPIDPEDIAKIQFGSRPEPPSPAKAQTKPVAKPPARSTGKDGPKLELGTFQEVRKKRDIYQDDAEVVGIVENLPPNTSAILPNFKVRGKDIEKWRHLFPGGPYRRDFGNKMAYAPDRDTALYAGGNHGVPHVLNDAWEYHLRSNSWNLIFPPDGGDHHILNRNLTAVAKNNSAKARRFLKSWFTENVVLKDGTLQTRNGGPIYPRHTWDAITYDRRTGRLMWAVLSDGSQYLETYARYTNQDPNALKSKLRRGSNLWTLDPDVGHWQRQTGSVFNPKMAGFGGTLHYVQDLGKSIWFVAEWNDDDGVWAFDGVTNQWTRLNTNNRSKFYQWTSDEFPRPSMQVAYSPKHKKLVAVRGPGVYVLDLRTNRWSKVHDDPATGASDSVTVFDYDTVNDVFLLANPGKWLKAYSFDTNRWTTLDPKGAGVFGLTSAGYFDERHGVFVLTSKGNKVWVYRYGPQTGQ